MWSFNKQSRDIALNRKQELQRIEQRRTGLINSFEVGDFIEDMGEPDNILEARIRDSDKLYEHIGKNVPHESVEERLEGCKKYRKENPDYGILLRVIDNRRNATIVGAPLGPSLMQQVFPFLFKSLPDSQPEEDNLIVNYQLLELYSDGIDMYGGTCLSRWQELVLPGGVNIERIRKASDEEVFKNLEKKLHGLYETIGVARSNPEEIYQMLVNSPNRVPFNFSKIPEKRNQELRLIACVQAAKHFRLKEIYDAIKNAKTPYERLACTEIHQRPGTNFFVVVDSMNAGRKDSVPPVAVQVIGYDNNKLDSYDDEIGREIAGRYPDLFGKSRFSFRSYEAIEIPSYALDLVTEALEMERIPMKKFVMLQAKSSSIDDTKRLIQE